MPLRDPFPNEIEKVKTGQEATQILIEPVGKAFKRGLSQRDKASMMGIRMVDKTKTNTVERLQDCSKSFSTFSTMTGDAGKPPLQRSEKMDEKIILSGGGSSEDNCLGLYLMTTLRGHT